MGDLQEMQNYSSRFFPNQASLIEPQLSQRFTQEMQDLFLRQTNLDLTNTGGDLRF